jgi:hypothetical protein
MIRSQGIYSLHSNSIPIAKLSDPSNSIGEPSRAARMINSYRPGAFWSDLF